MTLGWVYHVCGVKVTIPQLHPRHAGGLQEGWVARNRELVMAAFSFMAFWIVFPPEKTGVTFG